MHSTTGLVRFQLLSSLLSGALSQSFHVDCYISFLPLANPLYDFVCVVVPFMQLVSFRLCTSLCFVCRSCKTWFRVACIETILMLCSKIWKYFSNSTLCGIWQEIIWNFGTDVQVTHIEHRCCILLKPPGKSSVKPQCLQNIVPCVVIHEKCGKVVSDVSLIFWQLLPVYQQFLRYNFRKYSVLVIIMMSALALLCFASLSSIVWLKIRLNHLFVAQFCIKPKLWQLIIGTGQQHEKYHILHLQEIAVKCCSLSVQVVSHQRTKQDEVASCGPYHKCLQQYQCLHRDILSFKAFLQFSRHPVCMRKIRERLLLLRLLVILRRTTLQNILFLLCWESV